MSASHFGTRMSRCCANRRADAKSNWSRPDSNQDLRCGSSLRCYHLATRPRRRRDISDCDAPSFSARKRMERTTIGETRMLFGRTKPCAASGSFALYDCAAGVKLFYTRLSPRQDTSVPGLTEAGRCSHGAVRRTSSDVHRLSGDTTLEAMRRIAAALPSGCDSFR